MQFPVSKIFSEKISVFIALISFVCLLIAIFVFVIYGDWKYSPILDEEKVGQFGDFVGGVIGTLLAFVAAILYYVALKEQRKDIAINQESIRLQNEAFAKQIEEFEKQKEELELTRKVSEQQYKTMREQEHTMKLQQFESCFYSFLNVYRSIKNELNLNSEEKDFFKDIFFELKTNVTDNLQHQSPLDCHRKVQKVYVMLFLKYKGKLSHYFKTIYRLLRIIDASIFLSLSEKMFYAKIIRSQLTDYELLIMYYNYHSIYANKASLLVYKYNILKHINPLSKIEFQKKYNISTQDNHILASFFDTFSTLLEKCINQFCDSIDLQEVEEKVDNMNCIISISYIDKVSIKLSCFNISRIPQQFEQIVYDYLYDKLYITQFKTPEEEIADKTQEKFNETISLEYILNDKLIQKLNKDIGL